MANSPRKTPRTTQEFLDYRLSQTDESIANLSKDIKEVNDKLDGQNNATKPELEALKSWIIVNFVSKEQVKPYKWVVTAVGGSFLAAIGAGIAGFIISRISNG